MLARISAVWATDTRGEMHGVKNDETSHETDRRKGRRDGGEGRGGEVRRKVRVRVKGEDEEEKEVGYHWTICTSTHSQLAHFSFSP